MAASGKNPGKLTEECPVCGSAEIVFDEERGEYVCADCGLVTEDPVIDPGPEWRHFNHDQRQRRSRTGEPVKLRLPDNGMSTIIDWELRDSGGKKNPRMRRIRTWDARIKVSGSRERNFFQAFLELENLASKLQLPESVRELAASIYRKAYKEGIVRGRGIESVLGAAVFAACKEARVPRTAREIAEALGVSDENEVLRAYRVLQRRLNLKQKPAEPSDHLPRFASKLGVSENVQAKAQEIIEKAKEKGITVGKGPAGVAAAALYIASILEGERRTQKEIAEVARVTEVTIRNRYKEICEALGIELHP
ncbi:transcription initiation factor IIB [Methanopyrus sp.]